MDNDSAIEARTERSIVLRSAPARYVATYTASPTSARAVSAAAAPLPVGVVGGPPRHACQCPAAPTACHRQADPVGGARRQPQITAGSQITRQLRRQAPTRPVSPKSSAPRHRKQAQRPRSPAQFCGGLPPALPRSPAFHTPVRSGPSRLQRASFKRRLGALFL